MKNFKDYLKEDSSVVYFTFGRMNPPTIGHEKLMNSLAKKSGTNPYKVYLSQSQDPKSNPLAYQEKVKFVRRMFPRHARAVMLDKKVKNVFDVATKLYEQGFVNIVMVVGSDRVTEFKVLLKKYNGVKGRHGFYNFKTISVASAGERDPDAEGVEGMSASKQRENAKTNNFPLFVQGLPKGMSNKDARKLFNSIRVGMHLREERGFKNHIELATVSEEREKYVSGNLFNVGDRVIDNNLKEGFIKMLGSNYVSIQYPDNTVTRNWISDVKHVNEMMASPKVVKSHTMDPAHMQIKRDREVLRMKQQKEREASKQRHDKILDRARLTITKRKNNKEHKFQG